MALKLDELRRSVADEPLKSAEEYEAHVRRADSFKSLAKSLGHLMRNASAEERTRAFRSGRGL